MRILPIFGLLAFIAAALAADQHNTSLVLLLVGIGIVCIQWRPISKAPDSSSAPIVNAIAELANNESVDIRTRIVIMEHVKSLSSSMAVSLRVQHEESITKKESNDIP